MHDNIKYNNECIFCKDLSINKLTFIDLDNKGSFSEKIIDKNNIVLYKTDNFSVIPDISPLVLGHVLIVTKSHYTSMTEFEQAMFEELNEVIKYVDKMLINFFSKRIIHFEHGPGSKSANRLRSINHFHLHCLPLDIDLHSLIIKNINCIHKKINAYVELQHYTNSDYIFGESFNNKYIYELDKQSTHSQILRKLLYEYIKNEETYCLLNKYDWKRGIDIKAYFESKSILKQIFGGD